MTTIMTLPSDQLCRHYSLADIRSATQNFDDRLVVGEGGFGKVYKGHFKSEIYSSTLVAIKRLDLKSHQGAPEFQAEIEMLSMLRHAHLVSLLGCCAEGKEMILVYEYMPRGTVYHHLHHGNTPLTWKQLIVISIGAARGIDYLHTGAGVNHGVVHRDVKSSNILLDEDWAAKISDFGLAKICKINQSSSYVLTGIKGTFGYMDPEIFMTGKFTRKTDVFAFGVVLFELLSGRHAVLPDGDEDLSLARWAQRCFKKRNLDQVVSSEIRTQISPKCLKEFAQIAYRCLHSDPKERPTMSEVVVTLQLALALQEKFEGCAKPRGLIGFTWKIPDYFVLPRKENSDHSDEIQSRNNKNNSYCRTLLTEDTGDYSEGLPDNEQTHDQDLRIFSYTDLKCATSNFQYGKRARWVLVYKGWVHEKTYFPSESGVGLAITVVRLLRRPEGDLQLLGEFNHPNLQRLLGYCLEDGNFFLVHEFMEKRILNDYLRKGAVEELPFKTRVKIVVGVARGLVFLQCKKLIIKDWILDGNEIWLDKDFNAKLIHFDVARLVNRLVQYPLIGPSYRRRQCDVYGLGMLLMEILTGKPIFTITQMHLVMEEHLSGDVPDTSDMVIKNLVDPRMNLHATQTDAAREIIFLILEFTNNRYTMDQALEKLEVIYTRMTRR